MIVIFHEGNKYYSQAFLDDFSYKIVATRAVKFAM